MEIFYDNESIALTFSQRCNDKKKILPVFSNLVITGYVDILGIIGLLFAMHLGTWAVYKKILAIDYDFKFSNTRGIKSSFDP